MSQDIGIFSSATESGSICDACYMITHKFAFKHTYNVGLWSGLDVDKFQFSFRDFPNVMVAKDHLATCVSTLISISILTFAGFDWGTQLT